MQPYLISFGAGLLVGLVYAWLDVRSPAPPVIALLGLLGILVGEQARPAARWLLAQRRVEAPRGALSDPTRRAPPVSGAERTDSQTPRGPSR
jgi:XapX domain-containing protein